MPSIENHTVLDDGLNLKDESKIPTENRKCIFWQSSIKIKARVCIDSIVIEGLLEMGVDVTIITSESWHLNWFPQEADVQFLKTATLSQVNKA